VIHITTKLTSCSYVFSCFYAMTLSVTRLWIWYDIYVQSWARLTVLEFVYNELRKEWRMVGVPRDIRKANHQTTS